MISVLVFAYNRKKFVKNAIKSVIEQTLDKSNYEIIVISNFEITNISDLYENAISNIIIKHFILGNLSIGTYILKGLEESSGEIITFLDDDDLYERDRLYEIYHTFTSNPDIVYFRNSISAIDESGSVIPHVEKRRRCESSTYNLKEIADKGLSQFQWEMSTIAHTRL